MTTRVAMAAALTILISIVSFVGVAAFLSGCLEEAHEPTPTRSSVPRRSLDDMLAGFLPPGETMEPEDDRPGTIVAVGTIDSASVPYPSPAPAFQVEIPGETPDETQSPEAVDEWLITLEEATAYYGVEWARDVLIIVRFKESSNQVFPCKVGDRGELGPFQFMASTWISTPYGHLDACDLEAATWGAAWFVKEGRWLEWTTWPRE